MSAFEIFRDKKKKEKAESDASEKYRILSTRFAVLKWISLTALVIYVIVSVSLHGDELSFDSIRYIVRSMKDDPSSLVSNGDVIAFDYDSKNKAYTIGDDFAIVGIDGVTIYDYSGKILFSDNYSYDSPAAATNGFELMVYNIGGKEVRFYNSYSLVHRMTLDAPIYNISVSESGNYLFQTSSEGYRSGFRVYDKNKDLIFKNNYGELTLQSSDVSPNGNFAVSVAFSTADNQITSSVFMYDISKPKSIYDVQIKGEYPISVDFVGEDSIALFTDKSVKFFNSKLELKNSYFYGDRAPLKFDVSDNRVVIIYSSSLLNEKNEIEIISNNGEQVTNITVDSFVNDVCFADNTFYVLKNGTVELYDIDSKNVISSYQFSDTYSEMLKVSQGKFLLSRADKVEMFICD